MRRISRSKQRQDIPSITCLAFQTLGMHTVASRQPTRRMDHHAAATDEEERRMLELAMALSLAETSGTDPAPNTGGMRRQQPSSRPVSSSGTAQSSRPTSSSGAANSRPAYPPQPQGPQQWQAPSAPAQPQGQYPSIPHQPGAHFYPPPSIYPQPPYAQPPYVHPQPPNPYPQPAYTQPQQPSHHQPSYPTPPPPGTSPTATTPASKPAASKPAASSRSGNKSRSHSPQEEPARKLHPDRSKCAGCGEGVWGSRLNALDRVWHPKCFVCGFCSGNINDDGNTRFAIGHEDGWPYHMDCYKLKYHPVCSICQAFVPAREDGRIEYKQQAFWKETYCTRHASDGTPQCCSCNRYQPNGVEFPQLTDGRHLCLVCLGSVVVDTKDAQPLYQEVLSFFRNMGLAHPEQAPFMLVDAFTLNEYSSKEGKDVSGGPVFHVRGLTLATVYRSIPSIVRASGGGLGVTSTATALAQSSVRCSVSAVLVLYGLPRLLTGCIIAHELMHAWLRMKHVAGLDSRVEEGLCQLMAYIWLEHQANGLTDPEQQKLASFFTYQIREDLSETYGDGFRDALEAFNQRGLSSLINDVLRRGRFT